MTKRITSPTAVVTLLLTLVAGAVVALATPESANASGANNQYQHQLVKGDRGHDVYALQMLLNHRGFRTDIDGVFDSATRSAVISFQRSRKISADGVVGNGTWSRLTPTVRYRQRGNAVKAVQLMIRKQDRNIRIDGAFGPSTLRKVKTFQREHGLAADGVVGKRTWSRLLGHFEKLSSARNCFPSAPQRWMTASAAAQANLAGKIMTIKGHGKPAVTDASRIHGGRLAGHKSHQVGLDVDIRPFRKDKKQCSIRTNWKYRSYDRAATRDYIKAVLATRRVKVIWFNDPVLVREFSQVQPLKYHDNHLHVRFRESGFVQRADYR